MPSPAPEPLAPRALSIWLVDPLEEIPGEAAFPLRSWTLARVLAARGHGVTWWSATWSHARKVIRKSPLGILADEGFAVRLVAVRPYEKNRSLARIASHRDFGRTFERLASESISSGQLERPDIILAGVPPLEGAEAAARIAGRLNATFVLDARDPWPESIDDLLPGPGFLRRLISPFVAGGLPGRQQAIIAAADALAVTSHRLEECLPQKVGGSLPRHVCFTGVYVEEFPPPRQRINHVPLPDGPGFESGATAPLECVYADSGEGTHGLDLLAATARQLSAAGVDAIIHLVGDGAVEASRRRFSAAGGSCRVEVHGPLPRPALVGLLSRCDVGLLFAAPQARLVMPNEVFDYAAAGLALVTSAAGELRHLVDEYAAGVTFLAGDAASLGHVLAKLAADRGQLAAYRQHSRRLAAAVFDRETTYARFADWLETLPSKP